MAAGDRNKKGKPTDIVRHFYSHGNDLTDNHVSACGRKNTDYTTTNKSDVTCKACLRVLYHFKN